MVSVCKVLLRQELVRVKVMLGLLEDEISGPLRSDAGFNRVIFG